MIKHIRWTAMLVLALVLAALPVHSEVASTRVSSLQDRVNALQTTIDLTARRYEVARDALKQKQVQVDAGIAPPSELAPLQEQLLVLEAQLRQIEPQLRDARRLVKLASPVDVEVNEASLRQVAAALTKATGLQISVDERIKDDPKRVFTLKVQGAPLGQIVEQIADGADVLIAPAKDGIAFVPQARGSINGTDVAAPSPTSPWSTEWVMGGYARPAGQKWLGLIEAAAPVPAPPPVGGTARDFGLPVASQPLLAGMGPNAFVVGEQGPNDKAELGLWLQFYKIAGNKVTPGIRYFHRFAAGTLGASQSLLAGMGPNALVVGEPGRNDKGEPGMWLTFYSIDSGKMIPGIKYFHRFTAPAAQATPAAAPECGSEW